MEVTLRYVTDPACSWSWASEPKLRRLLREFGADLEVTYVMGGLARDYTAAGGSSTGASNGEGPWSWLFEHWVAVAAETGAPLDPRLWTESPIRSTYPAAMAVKAAAEQATDRGGAYLRALREGLMCFRRKLDTTDALVDEAGRAGLERDRFRSALGSSAIVEAFGADVEEARALAAEVPSPERERGVVSAGTPRERVTFPTAVFRGAGGERRHVFGHRPYWDYREAAIACGAVPDGVAPGVVDALRRFGRMTTSEVEAVCELPGPRAAAELWRLATEWRVRPTRLVTGWLWETEGDSAAS